MARVSRAGFCCILEAALLLCSTACGTPVAKMSSSDCDRLMASAEQSLLAGLDPNEAAILQRELDGSRAYWRTDANYGIVRARAENIGPWRSIVRLEIGRAVGGPGYSSVWFIETNDQVFELATGPELSAMQERNVPPEQWQGFVESVKDLTATQLPSRASPYAVDLAVYYFCAQLDGHESSLIVYDMPEEVPQFELVARTLGLSKFKRIPRELRALADR